MTSRRPIIITALAGAAFIGGCSSAASDPRPSSIRADVVEFSISLDSGVAAAGRVLFTVKNEGRIPHDFVVFRTDLAANELTVKDGAVVEDETGLDQVDEVEDVAAGTATTFGIDLKPGRYLLICNLPGHFQGGMRAVLQTS